MILKLSMQHRGLRLYKVDINEDPGMTLTYFTAMSIFFSKLLIVLHVSVYRTNAIGPLV